MTLKSLFLSVLFFSVSSFAVPQKYNYKNYWSKEKMTSGRNSFHLYMKDSPVDGIKNIAIMTVADLKNESFDSIFNQIKNSFGTNNKWTNDKIDGLNIYETYDISTSSLYRLAHNPKSNSFSFGSVKLRFLIPSYVELHLLQVEALTKVPSKKTVEYLYDLLLSKAYAQNYAAQASNYVSNIGAEALTKGLAGTNTTIDGLGDKQLESSKNVKDGLTGIKDELHSIAKKSNVVELTAIATLTSAVTAVSATFLLTGGYKLGRSLLYNLLGKFTPEDREKKINDFRTSLNTLEQLSPTLEKMEQQFTLVAASMAKISSESTEVTLKKMQDDINTLEKRVTEGKAECIDCLKTELVQQIQRLEDFRKVNQAAGATNVVKKIGEVCREVDSMFSTWKHAEQAVAQAQASVIKDVRVFMGYNSDSSKIKNEWREDTKQNNACINTPTKQIAAISQQQRDECDKNNDTNTGVCSDLYSARLSLKSCELAGENSKPENLVYLQESLNRSSSEMNAFLQVFSNDLKQLYCTDAADGVCKNPGPLIKISQAFKSRFKEFAAQCSDRVFAKTLKLTESVEPKIIVATDKSLFGGLFKNGPNQVGSQAPSDFLSHR